MKNTDTLTTYEAISPKFSTAIDKKLRNMKELPKNILIFWDQPKDKDIGKKGYYGDTPNKMNNQSWRIFI